MSVVHHRTPSTLRRWLCIGWLGAAIAPFSLAAAPPPDDSAIFTAYLNQHFGAAGQPAPTLLVVNEAEAADVEHLMPEPPRRGGDTADAAPETWQQVQRRLPEVSAAAALDLLAKTKPERPVVIAVDQLAASIRVIQVPGADIAQFFKTDEEWDAQWQKLHDKFGTSHVVRFSRVGHGSQGDEAVFTFRMGCGRLCGHGYLVLMRRAASGDWRLVKDERLWVS